MARGSTSVPFWQQLQVPNGLVPRVGHSATLVGSCMYVMGGRLANRTHANDV
ncbi:unnamed protein product, partial [Closterium sp. NIES-53]